MKTKYITGKNGYEIPYIDNLTGSENQIVLISHGFGSSKVSPTTTMLFEEMPQHNIGVVAFDFPSHGDSKASAEDLRVDNCIKDLATIEDMIVKSNPQAEILYFSSSFGAYINLLFISLCPHKGTKSFLRSAAVNMPELFQNPIPEHVKSIEEKGYLEFPYEPPLRITQGFVDDMNRCNLFEIYKPGKTKVAMIHGENDKTIIPEKAKAFSKLFNIDITMVPGGDHTLMNPGGPQLVLEKALSFYKSLL